MKHLTGVSAVAILILGWGTAPGTARAEDQPRLGYINHIPPEKPEDREARHKKVAERRAQQYIIMVHRGAHKFAPENTLEAYNAAIDHGADGCEIDIHRTKDGVLVMHHDDKIGRTVKGSGTIKDMTYYDLLEYRISGGDSKLRMPTLAAVLELARRRCMLIHLDIKKPDLEDDLIKMFDEADIWDHIVNVNGYNSEKIRADKRLKTYDYKGWIEEAGEGDRLQEFLARPQKLIFTKYDPARAVKAIGRKVEIREVPVPGDLRAKWLPAGPVEEPGTGEDGPASATELKPVENERKGDDHVR